MALLGRLDRCWVRMCEVYRLASILGLGSNACGFAHMVHVHKLVPGTLLEVEVNKLLMVGTHVTINTGMFDV